ncbi:MAG TPA: glycosyltransferase [Rhodobacteraceae bacterium]|nr:glycosyltransferase [Paracoccaceae bacterium]
MQPKVIRVIAPLPPKGNVAARHAGQVIYHLDAAGHDVRPSTTIGPAYSLDQLCFAPKAAYKVDRDRLMKRLGTVVLYPEGLDFAQISQEIWWHRWLERQRRLGLVWRLLWRARHSVVVFRPRLLKKPDHLAIVALACIAKLLRPRAVRLTRQINPPEKLVAPLLGRQPNPATPEDAELASLTLAVKHGAKGVVRLTPVWLRAAFNRLPENDPLYDEIKTLAEVVAHFGEDDLPVLDKPAGYITAAPFEDTAAPPVQGVEMSGFMLHIHQARRLFERFPLDTPSSAAAYQRWFLNQAPLIYTHALHRGAPEQISAALTSESIAKALRRMIANARFFGAEAGVDKALSAWLNTALPSGLTRLEILLAVLTHAPLSSAHALQKPWQAVELKAWFAARAFASYPALAGVAGLETPETPPAIITTGDSAKDTGLGQNQRMSETALKGLTPKRRLCLHHVNADAIPAQMLRTHTPDTFHIGFLLWELEDVPEAHALAGQVLDEVWTPTRFVQHLYQRAYDIPVTWVGKGFDLPAPAAFNASRLGIAHGQPFFLLSFDLHSSVARKNPLAAVLAFQMAFEGNPDARLVIKTSEPPKNHWGDPEQQMSIITKLMARDSRIILFQEHLPFAEYLGLISAATALVSPHRSEGFGYVPAYAMALGTPVIATDYAGTRDFCTAKTAHVIAWRTRVVRPGEPIYPLENAFWAEIDHEALAAAMQDVVDNPEAAKQRAMCGKALMLSEYSQAALRSRYKERLKALKLI